MTTFIIREDQPKKPMNKKIKEVVITWMLVNCSNVLFTTSLENEELAKPTIFDSKDEVVDYFCSSAGVKSYQVPADQLENQDYLKDLVMSELSLTRQVKKQYKDFMIGVESWELD